MNFSEIRSKKFVCNFPVISMFPITYNTYENYMDFFSQLHFINGVITQIFLTWNAMFRK